MARISASSARNFCNDLSEVMKFVNEAKVGVVKVDRPTIKLDQRVPYSGFEGSGNEVNKELGEEALQFHSRTKVVYFDW